MRVQTPRLFRIAAISGVIGATLPLILVFASTAIEKSFSWSRDALSDIGVTPTAWLFNSVLIIGGLLNSLFAIGLRKFLDKANWSKIGASLLIISSVSLSLVGVFTANYGTIHALVALGYLLLAPIAIICIGRGERSTPFGKLSLLAGVVALLAIFTPPILAEVANLQIGFSVAEFAEAVVLSIWTFSVSVKILYKRCT
jgi:hypothetical membrane protein